MDESKQKRKLCLQIPDCKSSVCRVASIALEKAMISRGSVHMATTIMKSSTTKSRRGRKRRRRRRGTVVVEMTRLNKY